MKNLLYLFILLIAPVTSFSQVNYTVKGKIVTSDGHLPFGNVIALEIKDSTLIKATSFFDGDFELTDLKHNAIILKFSSLEFDDTFLKIEYSGDPIIDLGEILVENSGTSLDAVVVKGQKPIYRQRNDGTVEVLIENTVLSASNSVNEILSKSPEVLVDESGALSVFGKGNAILYLNGKRIDNNQLSLISPSNVKKIEIIRNPSSKYDAEGAAVIHISTIQQREDGYQARIQQNADYSKFGGINTNSSLNVNYKKGRFTTNAKYSLQLGKERELLHTTRKRDAENVFLKTDLTTSWEREFKNFSYYGLGLQYDMEKEGYLSAEYSGFSESLGGNTFSNNNITDDFGSGFYKSNTEVDEEDKNHTISINYNKALDTLGAALFIGGQYSNFGIGTNNWIHEESIEHDNTSSRLLKNLQDLKVEIFSAQADLTKALKNSDVIEVGVKYSGVKNDFVSEFMVSNDGLDFYLDHNLSNNFNYQESVGAAYLSFKSSLNQNLNYTIGLRSEYTTYNLKISQIENQPIEDDFFNFFPNFSISKEFSNNFNLNFSYNSRITRVPYQRLNPVLIYQDPYTSIQGNPELRPQKNHSFELNSRIKETTINVGYNYTIDELGTTALRGKDTKSYILKRINYDKTHQFFVSVSRTFSNKWLTSRNSLNLRYTNYIENEYDFQRVTPKPNILFSSSNRIRLADAFHAELLFWYLGDNHGGLHRRNRMYYITASLEKSFLESALKCRIIANDIFHNRIASGNYNVGQTDVYYNRRWSTDYFRLSVSYNFGKLKKSNYKNKNVGKSDTDRI
ncbi:outer membrane beta-barrel family protein [Xanthovirga aplysinae]|uniref:outer membrane beta-barrel family protein n=1 Tax=Xanthovirga aplysinae TaxID=2529853 RepID=UPI0012BCEAD4|nr:outer membrane beta-barrel family protein [Xanthovirga aplysinae]MTI30897.1 TonB-dependent receptor [Xanthovirga aplysinae]